MSLISANSNIALLTPSRSVVVEPMRFVALTAPLQRAMLEWLEASEDGFQDVLTNTSIVGRMTMVFCAERGNILNEGTLQARLPDAERKFSAIKEIVGVVGKVERPAAVEVYFVGASQDRLHVLILPVTVDEQRLLMVTVGEW